MKIVRKNFIFRDLFLDLTSYKTLGEELSDDIFSLISSLSITIAANFRQKLLNFVIFAPEERINADLNNASVINRLSVEITFSNSVRNVAHNQKLFALFALIDCMIKDQIQDSFGDIGLVAWLEDRSCVLLQYIFVSKLCEPEFLVSALLEFSHELGAHKVHVLQNLESQFNRLLFQIFMETHVSWNLIHELSKFDQVLQSLRIFNITLVDENKRFPQLSFQND